MKKLIVTILAFLYITSSCDASIYLHYCMGKAVGFSFQPENSKSCQRCGMKKSVKAMNCCKDEHKIVKTDKNQKLTDFPSSIKPGKKYVTLSPGYRVYTVPIISSILHSAAPSHGPPDAKRPPAYIMNCLLLI